MDIQLWIPQDKSDNSHIEEIGKLTDHEIVQAFLSDYQMQKNRMYSCSFFREKL